MAGGRGIGREVSGGTRTQSPVAAGQRMGVPEGRGVAGRTAKAPGPQIAALQGHGGGLRGIRAG
jgi:hypothetical protein